MSNANDETLHQGPFSDERLRFYLRHRNQIEEWLALGKEVRTATVELFGALQPEMEALAASLGDDVRQRFVPGQWSSYQFWRETWPSAAAGPGVAVNTEAFPTVAVSMECPRDVDPAGDTPPSVGVSINSTDKELVIAIKEATKGLTGRYKRGSVWPIYRPLPAAAGVDWYQDARSWQQELVREMKEAWQELEPLIDPVLAAHAQHEPLP
jgi:hypothetical protein